jgi:hypothetical protein
VRYDLGWRIAAPLKRFDRKSISALFPKIGEYPEVIKQPSAFGKAIRKAFKKATGGPLFRLTPVVK